MDRAKALEKATRLLALATDPSQVKEGVPSEEARTAAWRACQIIREHKLLEIADAAQPPPPTPAGDPPQAPFRRERKKRRKPGPWASAFRQDQPSPSPEPEKRGGGDDSRGGRFMDALFPGQCNYCGMPIWKGDSIYWTPGFGSDHARCAMKRAGLKVE